MKKSFAKQLFWVVLSAVYSLSLTGCTGPNKPATVEASAPKQKRQISTETLKSAKAIPAQLIIDTEFPGIIKKLEENINDFPITGNYDMDVVKLMSIHHFTAVETIEAQLRHGNDEKLKEITTEILQSEKKEMAEVLGIVRELRFKPGDQEDAVPPEASKKLSAEALTMMKSIVDSLKAADFTGDVDLDFVAVMRPYQKGTIAIAKMAAKESKFPKIKKLSQQILADKESELKEIKDWMKKKKKVEVAKSGKSGTPKD